MLLQISEFQEIMRRIYFHRDSGRGAPSTFKWLKDEVQELGEAMEGGDKKALDNEFADVLAWLASLANVLCVDLEAAAWHKYDRKCPKCLQARCVCSQ
jgi:NTP pyrophosphatase (non-canonical NTP hydrolase)